MWAHEMFPKRVLPEDRADVERDLRHAVRTRTDRSFEYCIRRVGGDFQDDTAIVVVQRMP